jgi:hypothetical protein
VIHEPFSFYADLIRYPLMVGSGRRAYVQASLMASTQVANALGYFYQGTHDRL